MAKLPDSNAFGYFFRTAVRIPSHVTVGPGQAKIVLRIQSLTVGVITNLESELVVAFARGVGGIRPAPLPGGRELRIRFAINSAGEGLGMTA